jgi:hypothetical protein
MSGPRQSTTLRLTILVAVTLLATSPVSAVGPLIDGYCALPSTPDGRAPFAVHGWAVADCGEGNHEPPELVLRVDGAELLRGRPFTAWPGISEKYPDIPGSDLAGFWAQVDPAHLAVGEHDLEVVALACGIERTLLRENFSVSKPTSSLIAGPLLLLCLGILAAIGCAIARFRDRFWPIPRLPGIVALGSLLVIVIVVLAPRLAGSVREIGDGLFGPLANWDGRYYLIIADQGYRADMPELAVFFPLYPALLALLSLLGGPAPLAAALANAGLFVAAIVLMRRLYPEQDNAILFFAVMPFAFFHVVVYTEALALLLALAFVDGLRNRRLGRTAVLGFLAGLTRITGTALILFAIEPLRRKDWRAALTAAAAPAAGLAAWMLALAATTGDPLAFLHAQRQFERSTAFDPGRLLDVLLSSPVRGPFVWWELSLLATVLICSAALLARGRMGEGCYSAAVILLPLFTLRLASLNRYALAAFPVFLLLGGMLASRLPRRVFTVIVAIGMVLLCFFAARFGRQFWVG